MGEGEVHIGMWWENSRDGDYFEDPSLGGRMILIWIFRKWMGGWTRLIWLRIGTGGGLL